MNKKLITFVLVGIFATIINCQDANTVLPADSVAGSMAGAGGDPTMTKTIKKADPMFGSGGNPMITSTNPMPVRMDGAVRKPILKPAPLEPIRVNDEYDRIITEVVDPKNLNIPTLDTSKEEEIVINGQKYVRVKSFDPSKQWSNGGAASSNFSTYTSPPPFYYHRIPPRVDNPASSVYNPPFASRLMEIVGRIKKTYSITLTLPDYEY